LPKQSLLQPKAHRSNSIGFPDLNRFTARNTLSTAPQINRLQARAIHLFAITDCYKELRGEFMFSINKTKIAASAVLLAGVIASAASGAEWSHDREEGHIRHVLLISVDGMHAVDYLNCSKGVSGVNNGAPYCPNIANLGQTGVNFLETSTSKPSDSFPGLMALVTGGSPRTTGVFYDVAYDRSLDAPAKTTGNGVAAGPCTAGSIPTGTRTEYEEGIDIDQTKQTAARLAQVSQRVASIQSTRPA
jgi:hypothetical protein